MRKREEKFMETIVSLEKSIVNLFCIVENNIFEKIEREKV